MSNSQPENMDTSLAQPEPVALTDEDLEDLAEVMNVSGNPVPAMRRALELWGNSQRILDSSAQPEPVAPKPVAPKPVVDYSRVPKIATEAQIRAAAQYLVKKRHCDGDLIPAIEYAIARWGTPAIELVPVASEVRASVVELQVGVEFLDNEGLVVIANYLRRAIALLQRLSTSTNQEESE
jgi:hypothetical protein